MCDCICNQPQYANHGAICPICEEERDLRDRIMEDNQREYEWLQSEQQEACWWDPDFGEKTAGVLDRARGEMLDRIDRTDWSIGFHDFEYNAAEADAAYYKAMRQEESDSY